MNRDWRRRYTPEQRSRGGRNRLRREERFEEVRARFLDDRKGFVIAEGLYLLNGKLLPYVLRHSVSHVQKFDLVIDGRLHCCSGWRGLPCKWMRIRAREARRINVCYAALECSVFSI